MSNKLFVVLSGVLGLFVAMLMESRSAAQDAAAQTKTARQKLEALCGDLYGEDPAVARAVIKLFKNPGVSVPFLKEELQPLNLNADECRKLLKELGSNDEQVWKRAWTRAVRAVAVLEQINTPEAVSVLNQLGKGHPDALPTKAAQEGLWRMLPVIDPFGKTK